MYNGDCSVNGPAVLDGQTGTDTVVTNGRRTALHYGSEGEGGAQSLSYQRTGRPYVEFTVLNWVGIDTSVGLVKRGGVYNDMHYGNDKAIALYFADGSVWHSDTEVAVLGEIPRGSRIDMAADLDQQRVWFRINNGGWLGSSENASPETGVGGFEFNSFDHEGAAPMILFAGPNIGPGGHVVMESEPSGSIPSGFREWPR